jgi:N-acetyltransferase
MFVLGQNRTAPSARVPLLDGLELRPLEPGDRNLVTAVVEQWWGRPVGDLVPRPFFSEFRDTCFVLVRGDELIGFLVGFLSQTAPDDAYIHAVAVAPGWRGRGLARLLYERFGDVARRNGRRRIRAITSPVNAASIAFHRQLGFSVDLPAEAEGDDGRVRFLLELTEPTSIDLDSATPCEATSVLRTPLPGTLIALEPLARRHEDDLADAAAASDWTLMPLDASGREGFNRWLDWMLAANLESRDPRAVFAVTRTRDGRAVGSTSFHSVHPEHRRLEIGMTWYARSEWGSGANVEAKLLMLTRAFALGFRRVEFKTEANNLRSRRALEALPAQLEGVLRKHMLVRDGEGRDSAYYSVIDDEWPAVRANLERRLAEHRQREEGRHRHD